MATKIKRDDQSLRIVKESWGPVLQRYSDLPNNWVHHREVLVSRSPRLAQSYFFPHSASGLAISVLDRADTFPSPAT